MANCKIDTGLTSEDCEFIFGGIESVYLANKSQVVAFVQGTSKYEITDITMGSAGLFYKFPVAEETSSFTDALTVSGASRYVLQTIDFFTPATSITAREVAEDLALSSLVAIVEKKTGELIVFGYTVGLKATVVELNSGVALGDNTALHVTLTAPSLGFGKVFTGDITDLI